MTDHHHEGDENARWEHEGIRVVPANSLWINTPQTLGMSRLVAIEFARVGAKKFRVGAATVLERGLTVARWSYQADGNAPLRFAIAGLDRQ